MAATTWMVFIWEKYSGKEDIRKEEFFMIENMVVCFDCLRAIESREGKVGPLEVNFDKDEGQKCEWCGDDIEEGYEIIPD